MLRGCGWIEERVFKHTVKSRELLLERENLGHHAVRALETAVRWRPSCKKRQAWLWRTRLGSTHANMGVSSGEWKGLSVCRTLNASGADENHRRPKRWRQMRSMYDTTPKAMVVRGTTIEQLSTFPPCIGTVGRRACECLQAETGIGLGLGSVHRCTAPQVKQ